MTNYTQKVVFGSSMIFIFSVVASVIAYLTKVFLARKITVEEYGLFFAVFSFLSFFFFIREFGLNSALVKFLVDFKIQNKLSGIKTAIFTTLFFQFATSTLLVISFFVFSNFLISDYFKFPSSWLILKILFIYLFFSILFRIMKSIFQAFHQQFLFAFMEPVKDLLVFLSIFVFTFFDLGIYALAWGYSLSAFLLFIFFLPSLIKTLRQAEFFSFPAAFDFQVSKSLLSFGLPFLITGMSGTIIGYLDVIMLTYSAPIAEVGIYNAVLSTALILLFLSRPLCSVTFPLFAEFWAKNDLRKIVQGLHLLYENLSLILVPFILLLFVYADLIMGFMFGTDYLPGATPLRILLLGMLVLTIGKINDSTLTALGLPMIITKITVIASLVNIVLNFLLIPRYSLNGAAFATAVSYFLVFLLSSWQLRKHLPLKLPWGNWFKFMLLGSCFVYFAFNLKELFLNYFLNPYLSAILNSLVSCLLFFILAYLFGLLNFRKIRTSWKMLRG